MLSLSLHYWLWRCGQCIWDRRAGELCKDSKRGRNCALRDANTRRGRAMRKSIGLLLILGVSTLSLMGCSFGRVAGPCYGVGCPSFTSSGQPKVAAVPQPTGGNAPAQKSAAAAPAASPAQTSQAVPAQADASRSDAGQAKPGRFTRMLTALHLHSKS